jgi:hypothetical protein
MISISNLSGFMQNQTKRNFLHGFVKGIKEFVWEKKRNTEAQFVQNV